MCQIPHCSSQDLTLAARINDRYRSPTDFTSLTIMNSNNSCNAQTLVGVIWYIPADPSRLEFRHCWTKGFSRHVNKYIGHTIPAQIPRSTILAYTQQTLRTASRWTSRGNFPNSCKSRTSRGTPGYPCGRRSAKHNETPEIQQHVLTYTTL